MATIVRTKEASWRAVVRRKGKYACRTFRLKSHASKWALEAERQIDLGGEPGLVTVSFRVLECDNHH